MYRCPACDQDGFIYVYVACTVILGNDGEEVEEPDIAAIDNGQNAECAECGFDAKLAAFVEVSE